MSETTKAQAHDSFVVSPVKIGYKPTDHSITPYSV